MKKKIAVATAAAAGYLAWAGNMALVFANHEPSHIEITRPVIGGRNVGPSTIGSFIQAAVSLAFIVALILVFFFLIFGGIKWIISGGDQKQTEAARNMITAAIVGLAIVALAYAITKVLETFFNVQILGGFTIPSTQ